MNKYMCLQIPRIICNEADIRGLKNISFSMVAINSLNWAPDQLTTRFHQKTHQKSQT